jgi:hypothetical protein
MLIRQRTANGKEFYMGLVTRAAAFACLVLFTALQPT